MSYPVKISGLSRSNPLTANHFASTEPPSSALVFDFICLFTHDLKRKQKRWQDGKLKYHTFNRRVMVYDDRGHFIGDAHWQGDEALEEGEEIELDRGGAIVEVQECVGSKEQDLTEIIDKRTREVEKRREMAASKTQVRSSTAIPRMTSSGSVGDRETPSSMVSATAQRGDPKPNPHMTHRALTSMLQSPGPIGRANISDQSPFEARREVQTGRADLGKGEINYPSAKRRKLAASPPAKRAGHAQALFGTRLTLSATPMSLPSHRAEPLRESTNVYREWVQEQKRNAEPVKDAKVGEVPQRNNDPELPVLAQVVQAHDDRSLGDTVVGTKSLQTASGTRNRKNVPSLLIQHQSQTRARSISPEVEVEVVEQINKPDLDKGSRQKKSATVSKAAERPVSNAKLARGVDRNLAESRSIRKEPQTTNKTAPKARMPKAQADHTSPMASQNSKEDAKMPCDKTSKEHDYDKHISNSSPLFLPRKEGEPRTELRIRSRKKRGLLMMSEKTASHDPPFEEKNALEGPTSGDLRKELNSNNRSTQESDKPSQADTHLSEVVATPSETDTQKGSRSRSGSTVQDMVQINRCNISQPNLKSKSSEVTEDAEGTEGRSTNIAHKEVSSVIAPTTDTEEIHDTIENGHAPETVPSSIPLVSEKNKTLVVGDLSDKDPERNLEELASGYKAASSRTSGGKIRTKKLGNRNVKSKEVIGLLPETNNLDIPLAFLTANSPLGEITGTSLSTQLSSEDRVDHSDWVSPKRAGSGSQDAHTPRDGREQASSNHRTDDAMSAVSKDSQPAIEDANREQCEPAPTMVSSGPGLGKTQSSCALITNVPEATSTVNETIKTKPPVPNLLPNPASRGRKAALKQHAAGQPVKSVVPVEAVKTHAPLASSREKGGKSVDLPGFSKANGGPWSKHAYDLLGIHRPTEPGPEVQGFRKAVR